MGNLVKINIKAALGAGSVTTVLGLDGVVTINLVPAAAGPGAIDIATQLNAATMAAKYVTAVGGGTGTVNPVSGLTLSGGDGAGIARLDVAGSATNSGLRLLAVKPGNDQNLISGSDITVTCAGTTETIANLVTALAADSAAAALVTASSLDQTGSIGTLAKTYLYGGAAETPSITVGGAVSTITAHSDTSITVTVTAAALATAGVVAADLALVLLHSNYGILYGGQAVVADTT